ncbi:MAG TPA: DUF3891 family protein [Thermoanaerobaculia bacterium]|jgi:hypothetical protein
MIVSSHDGRLRCVTQSDHAHLAADLLSIWVTDGLPEHPRRRELLLAAREHDNGWQEADSAPFHDPETGRPHDFMTLPSAERRRIWLRGPRRHAGREPYASLLITRHALELHRDRAGDPEWAEVFAVWRSLEEELHAATGAGASTLADDYRWIDLTDVLSLTACGGLDRPVERHGFRGEAAGGVLAIDPFPLAGATTLRVPCRDVPARRYVSDADLAMELITARWRELAVRVVAL